MSKQDTCIFYHYFGDYGMSLCDHPMRAKNQTIYSEDCRKCKLHQTEYCSLEKCPFCGGKANINNYLGTFHITCSKCGVVMEDDEIDSVMKKWNRRTKGENKNVKNK